MFGLNQDECCSGDVGCVPTAWAAARVPGYSGESGACVLGGGVDHGGGQDE